MWSRAFVCIGFAGLLAVATVRADNLVYITDFSKTRVARMPAGSLKEYRNDADKYAMASHIRILRDGDPDEVRVWYSWATFNPLTNGVGTIGYVVADKHSRKCLISYPPDSVVPQKGACSAYAAQQNPQNILAGLSRLAGLANSVISCNVQDGDWELIDAVSSGKRFVLFADNPGSCRGEEARRVSRLLNAIAESSSQGRKPR